MVAFDRICAGKDFTTTLVELTCTLSYHYFAHLPVHDVPFYHCAARISVLGNVYLSVSVCMFR